MCTSNMQDNPYNSNKFKWTTYHSYAVPDLPLCLGLLKHRAALTRGPHIPSMPM